MIRFLIPLLAGFIIIAGLSQAQQRPAQGDVIPLSPQIIEALQQDRLDLARSLIEEASATSRGGATRTPMTAHQIRQFLCTPDTCICNGARDCLDLGQVGLCKPGTTRCDEFMNECECDRISPSR